MSLSEIARMPAGTRFREVGYPDIVLTFIPYDKGYGPDEPPILHWQKLGGNKICFGSFNQAFVAAEFEVLTDQQFKELQEADRKIHEERKAAVPD